MKYVSIKGGTKLSHYIRPMLARLSDEPAFDDPNWVFEIKWDGYRAVAEIASRGIRFYSRNGTTYHKAYPRIYDALQLIQKDTIIDGEVVAFDQEGKPSFQALQNYKNRTNVPVQYYVFDCLAYEGNDVTDLPLLERKQILQQILPESKIIRYCDHIQEKGIEFYEQIVAANLEGMIAKKADSRYHKGKRTSSWLKIKNVQNEDAVIVGFTDPKGSRIGFGSLLLATRTDDQLTYIGNVGTGFTDQTLKNLHAKLKTVERQQPALEIPIKITKEMHWVEPVYACRVKFAERTDEGIRRHPVFMGIVDG